RERGGGRHPLGMARGAELGRDGRRSPRALPVGAIRPEIDSCGVRPRDSATRRLAPGPRLASGGVHPALRVVLGGTQVAVSLHGLAIVLGVGSGALLAVRRAREPAPVLVAAAAVAATSLAGGHALFALLHGGGGALWT